MEQERIKKLIEDGVEILAIKVAVTENGVCGYMQMDKGIASALKENGIDLDEFKKRTYGKTNKLIEELCKEVKHMVNQIQSEGMLC